MMSDMKTKAASKKKRVRRRAAATPLRDTFTVRDLNRQPQVVLSAARKLGRVTIRSRSDGAFVITHASPAANARVQEAEAFCQRFEALREQMRSRGFVRPSARDSKKIARMIAGEEP